MGKQGFAVFDSGGDRNDFIDGALTDGTEITYWWSFDARNPGVLEVWYHTGDMSKSHFVATYFNPRKIVNLGMGVLAK